MFPLILYMLFLIINTVECDNNFKVDKNDIQPFVYHLELEGVNNEHKFHYIGLTKNLNQRWTQHILGKGSKWTKLHKPVKILDFWVNGSPELENTKTYELMDKYGVDRVRGGVCHCPILSECNKFGCKYDEVYSSEDAEQFEIGKRIRFVLDNDWAQQILLTISSVSLDIKDSQIKYDDIAYIKKSFKYKSGKWYLYYEKNQAMSYIPLYFNDYKLHYHSANQPNLPNDNGWIYYIVHIIEFISTIYKVHFKLGDLGLGYSGFSNIDNYNIITLYNLFKNQ